MTTPIVKEVDEGIFCEVGDAELFEDFLNRSGMYFTREYNPTLVHLEYTIRQYKHIYTVYSFNARTGKFLDMWYMEV